MIRRLLLCCALLPAVAATAGAAVRWNEILRPPAEWYATSVARAITDRVIRCNLAGIEAERRGGCRWHGDEPAALLGKDYPRWRAKNKQP